MLTVGKQRGLGGDQETEKACEHKRIETAATGENSRNEATSNLKESNYRNYAD